MDIKTSIFMNVLPNTRLSLLHFNGHRVTISLTVSNLVKASLWSSSIDLAWACDPCAVETETVTNFGAEKWSWQIIPQQLPQGLLRWICQGQATSSTVNSYTTDLPLSPNPSLAKQDFHFSAKPFKSCAKPTVFSISAEILGGLSSAVFDSIYCDSWRQLHHLRVGNDDLRRRTNHPIDAGHGQ